jgi:hypothetical protein
MNQAPPRQKTSQTGPQSTPASPWFRTPSKHDGASQIPAQQTPLSQSSPVRNPSPAGHSGHDGAPYWLPPTVGA